MRLLVSIILTTLCLAGCGGEKAKPQRSAPLVEVRPITTAPFSDDLEAVGTALANEQVVLSSPVTERIERIHFSDGGYVRQGQVVATMAVMLYWSAWSNRRMKLWVSSGSLLMSDMTKI